MIRKALIIYCDNTGSGELPGPVHDNDNLREYLKSNLGGNWHDDEIMSLNNPTKFTVQRFKKIFLNNADYTFIVFSGHGYIGKEDRKQYLELIDGDISKQELKTNAPRQTIIIDACRGYVSRFAIKEDKSLLLEGFPRKDSTRDLFDQAIMESDEGLTILYAASKNQSALDTNEGAAYLLSLIQSAKSWESNNESDEILDLKEAHILAKEYLDNNFEDTIQVPAMNKEKRSYYFPFAVKFI